MTRSLPKRPSLESLQKQARALLRKHRAGDASALARVKAHHPRPARFSGLRDAQMTIAREYGLADWSELRRAVELALLHEMTPAERAREFLDLACLSYRGDDAPGRIARAARLLHQAEEIGEHDVYTAAAAGNVDALARFLETDAALANARGGPRSWPPLLYLAYSRIPDAPARRDAMASAHLLIERGADPNASFRLHDVYLFTALTGAIGEGEQGLERQPPHAHAEELARRLLDAGANPNDSQGLYNSMFTPSNVWIERMLERGLGPEDRVNWGADIRMLDYLLCTAVTRGFSDRVTLLLRRGADPNAVDPYNHRPAYINARREGHGAIARALLDAGARAQPLSSADELRVACMSGDCAAASAIAQSQPELVRHARLICDVSRAGHREVVELLLELGADVHASIPGGTTPLHHAAAGGHHATAELLLERGARLDARDEIHGGTPIGWAHHNGQYELRDAMLDRTTDVFDLVAHARIQQLRSLLAGDPRRASLPRAGGITPLHALRTDGERGEAVIELLLGAGARINAVADDGRTPLDVALASGAEEIAELLRLRGARRGRR